MRIFEPLVFVLGITCAIGSATAATIFTTAKDTDLRLAPGSEVSFKKGSQPTENEISIFVNPKIHFQTMLGFGGR